MAEKEWTDELKAQVVEAYEERNPTADNTLDIVKELAVEYEKAPNGIRMILSKAGVYVKKTPATAAKVSAEGTTSKRVNKAEAIAALKATITDLGKDVDSDICDRLTGKAAVYINSLLA